MLYRSLISLALVMTPATAWSEGHSPVDGAKEFFEGASIERCRSLIDALDIEELSRGESTLVRQVRLSVEYYCRASRIDEELVALGLDPSDIPATAPTRSLDQLTVPELPADRIESADPELANRLQSLAAQRGAFLEGGAVYLDLAVQADPDAANDLLRRLLGDNPPVKLK